MDSSDTDQEEIDFKELNKKHQEALCKLLDKRREKIKQLELEKKQYVKHMDDKISALKASIQRDSQFCMTPGELQRTKRQCVPLTSKETPTPRGQKIETRGRKRMNDDDTLNNLTDQQRLKW